MRAGPELSVAATKTFVAIARRAAARSTAAWTDDAGSPAALDRLPERLAAAPATRLERGAATRSPTRASLIAIGRGPTLAIAREAALKLKEICNLHAEAFSGAEFLHGPVALVVDPLSDPDVHADRCGRRRACGSSPPTLARQRRGAVRRRAGRAAPARLPALAPDHPETDAICLIQSFYAMAVRLAARARHRRRPAAPSAEGDAHPMTRVALHAVAAERRVRRRGAARDDAAVVIEGDRHRRVCAAARAAGRACRCGDCRTGAWLAPGFIDMQVNGGGDVLFNDDPTPEGDRRDRRGAPAVRHDRRCCRP